MIRHISNTLFFSFALTTIICRNSLADEILLGKNGGVFELPVNINDKITLNFILDTGASEVHIPADVFLTLARTNTIGHSHFLKSARYQIADGSIVESKRVRLQSLKIGDHYLTDVTASIGQVDGPLLLGQNALSQLEPWYIDSNKMLFVMERGEQMKTWANGDRGDTMDNSEQRTAISALRSETMAMNEFVQDYLEVSANCDMSEILNTYAEQVNYYGVGVVDKTFIRKDKNYFCKRWPIIQYNLAGEVNIINHHEASSAIEFLINFTVKNPPRAKSISGMAKHSLTLKTINGELKIFNEKQEVINRIIRYIL